MQTLNLKRRRKMGKIAQEIRKIQIDENLTLPELFEKYPHLARLQHLEILEEKDFENIKENKKNLILG
jgi:ribonucleotide reductase beta subunit family protein with ferritin-like domain